MRESDNPFDYTPDLRSEDVFDEPEYHCCAQPENQDITHQRGDIVRLKCRVCGAVWTEEIWRV